MIDLMPNEIIDNIVLCTDVLSIPYFKATCKTVSNQITDEHYNNIVIQHIKKKLEDIINIVRSYHDALTNKDVEEKLLKMLLVKIHNDKYYHDNMINHRWAGGMMLYNVSSNTNYRARRVIETWMRYINDKPFEENDTEILDCLKKYVLGTDKSIYVVSFNYIDKLSNKKSHYCVINLQFHDTGDVKMAFSIEDIKVDDGRSVKRCYRDGRPVQRSVRFVEIFVNDTTLTELAECIFENLGRKTCLSETNVVTNIDKWVGFFTKDASKLFDDTIDSFVNPESYRNKIIDILT